MQITEEIEHGSINEIIRVFNTALVGIRLKMLLFRFPALP